MKRILMLLPLVISVVLLVAQAPSKRSHNSDDGSIFQRLVGSKTSPVTYRGSLASDFGAPLAVVASESGEVFVADTGNSVVKRFSRTGTLENIIGRKGDNSADPKDGDLFYPVGLAIGPNGALYVSDLLSSKVSVFSPGGQFLFFFGKNEEGGNPFKAPVGLQYRDGYFYVSDVGKSKVMVLGLDGSLVRELGNGYGFGQGNLAYASYACIDAEGNVWVSDSNNSRVQVFDRSGAVAKIMYLTTEKSDMSLPRGVAHDHLGYLHVANALGHRIDVINQAGKRVFSYGESGTQPGQFGFPNGISIAGKMIYITDRANNRVQIWEHTG